MDYCFNAPDKLEIDAIILTLISQMKKKKTEAGRDYIIGSKSHSKW